MSVPEVTVNRSLGFRLSHVTPAELDQVESYRCCRRIGFGFVRTKYAAAFSRSDSSQRPFQIRNFTLNSLGKSRFIGTSNRAPPSSQRFGKSKPKAPASTRELIAPTMPRQTVGVISCTSLGLVPNSRSLKYASDIRTNNPILPTHFPIHRKSEFRSCNHDSDSPRESLVLPL